MKTAFSRVAIVAIAGLAGAFVVWRALSLVADLGSAPAIERPALLAPALALYAATLVTYACLWREVVCRLDGRRTPVIDGVAVFCASWLGRYVPSSLPYVAGKLVLGVRLGHTKPALAASLLYENALLVSLGVLSSAVLLAVTGGGLLLYAGAGLGGLLALIAISPPVFHRAVNAAAWVVRRPRLPREALLSYRGVAVGAGLAMLALALNGACFALVLSAFVDLNGRELVASAAIFNLAGAVGVAVLPVPSGLGVREAILIGLLQTFVPLEVAAAAAVVARLISISADVALGLAGAAVVVLRQGRASDDALPSERGTQVA